MLSIMSMEHKETEAELIVRVKESVSKPNPKKCKGCDGYHYGNCN